VSPSLIGLSFPECGPAFLRGSYDARPPSRTEYALMRLRRGRLSVAGLVSSPSLPLRQSDALARRRAHCPPLMRGCRRSYAGSRRLASNPAAQFRYLPLYFVSLVLEAN